MKLVEKIRSFIRKRPSAVLVAAAVAVLAVIVAAMPVTMQPVAAPAPETTPTPIPTPMPSTSIVATPLPLPEPEETPDGSRSETLPTPEPTPKVMLPRMAELFGQNSDIVGWLKIDGTRVDYPVMHTPNDGENGEFYLYRNFDKKDDKRGTLFVDKGCTTDPRSTNLLIHGHNNSDGTMFRTLLSYKNESFYKQHPTLIYSSLYEEHEYEIVSVFLSRVYYVDDIVFKFYQFFNAETEEEFDYYIENVKERALYDTGVSAKFGDELITLSTCEYSQENGRLVVVARRVAANIPR